MYLEHFGLQLKPFQISTDPKFLYLGEKHQEALAVLKYGIQDNKGFLLLTGDVGTGKTTLLNALVDSLEEDVLVAMVPDPGLTKMDFFNFIADSFGMNRYFAGKGEFLIYLRRFLTDLNRQRRQALLIIDECQHLSQKLLEEIRLLSNIEKAESKLINIFFVGQSEFNDSILKPQNRAIRQRITINYNISPLSETETDEYIRFRLDVAGAMTTIFTPRAIEEIYRFSNGYPRLINIICDQALLTGFVKERGHVDEQIVAECANELKIKTTRTIDYSDAIPEARMAAPTDASLFDQVTAALQKYLQPKKHLMLALMVVLALWVGLVATYLLSNQTSDATHSASTDKAAAESAPAETNAAAVQADSKATGETAAGATQLPASAVPESPPGEAADDLGPADATDGDPASAKALTDDESMDVKQVLAMLVSKIREEPAPEVTLEAIQARYGTYPEVRFDVNSNDLDEAAFDVLGMVAQFWLQNPESILVLRGYTDRSGLRTYNLKLSEFRANMVRSYLVGRGVKEEAISAIALGPDTEGPGGTTVPHDGVRRKVVIEIVAPQG